MGKLDFDKIKLLILDVDGVLTDGSFFISDSGEVFRKFNVLDGYGIKTALSRGVEVAIITGGTATSIVHRSEYLGIKYLFLGREDKREVYFENIKPTLNITDSEVAFIGDDVYDIPLMEIVGIPITVPNAHECLKRVAKYVTKNVGGDGAVREVIDLILGV